MVKNNLFNKEIRRKDFVGNGTHPLSWRIWVEAKVEDNLGITSHEANLILGGK